MRHISLRKLIPRALILISFVISIYFLVAPFYPEIEWQLSKVLVKPDKVTQQDSSLQNGKNADDDSASTQSQTGDVSNRIVITAANIDMQIIEGATDDSLSKGAWRRPNSSTPDKLGNTVITGHRFQYLLATNKTFYNLDKLQKEDRIRVIWEGREYLYSVSRIYVTDPNDLSVESDKNDTRLTLYTCTPMWTSTHRLVIVALPLK